MGKCFYMIICSLVIGEISSKVDKRKVMIFGFFAYAFGMFCIRILPATIPFYIFALCFSALGNATFWTLIYSVLADVITIDAAEHGTNRAGAMTSLLSMCNKFGCSFGMWAVGVGLTATGFVEKMCIRDRIRPCWEVIFAVVFFVWPLPMREASRITVRSPAACKKYAVSTPANPAPITAASALISPGSAGRPGSVSVLLQNDLLIVRTPPRRRRLFHKLSPAPRCRR